MARQDRVDKDIRQSDWHRGRCLATLLGPIHTDRKELWLQHQLSNSHGGKEPITRSISFIILSLVFEINTMQTH